MINNARRGIVENGSNWFLAFSFNSAKFIVFPFLIFIFLKKSRSRTAGNKVIILNIQKSENLSGEKNTEDIYNPDDVPAEQKT